MRGAKTQFEACMGVMVTVLFDITMIRLKHYTAQFSSNCTAPNMVALTVSILPVWVHCSQSHHTILTNHIVAL